jgi:hypothetical protein
MLEKSKRLTVPVVNNLQLKQCDQRIAERVKVVVEIVRFRKGAVVKFRAVLIDIATPQSNSKQSKDVIKGLQQ